MYIYIHICIYTYIYLYTHTYKCIHICKYANTHILVYISITLPQFLCKGALHTCGTATKDTWQPRKSIGLLGGLATQNHQIFYRKSTICPICVGLFYVKVSWKFRGFCTLLPPRFGLCALCMRVISTLYTYIYTYIYIYIHIYIHISPGRSG